MEFLRCQKDKGCAPADVYLSAYQKTQKERRKEDSTREPSASALAELAWSPRSSEDSKYHPSELNLPAVSPTREPLDLKAGLENDVLHDHRGDSWTTSSGDTMGPAHILGSISIDSPRSSSGFLEDSTPPFLDVAAKAATLRSTTGIHARRNAPTAGHGGMI